MTRNQNIKQFKCDKPSQDIWNSSWSLGGFRLQLLHDNYVCAVDLGRSSQASFAGFPVRMDYWDRSGGNSTRLSFPRLIKLKTNLSKPRSARLQIGCSIVKHRRWTAQRLWKTWLVTMSLKGGALEDRKWSGHASIVYVVNSINDRCKPAVKDGYHTSRKE